jgi:hypothetical protein
VDAAMVSGRSGDDGLSGMGEAGGESGAKAPAA